MAAGMSAQWNQMPEAGPGLELCSPMAHDLRTRSATSGSLSKLLRRFARFSACTGFLESGGQSAVTTTRNCTNARGLQPMTDTLCWAAHIGFRSGLSSPSAQQQAIPEWHTG